MSIIKKNIKLNNNSSGATITFGLSSNDNFNDYQQEINNLTEKTKLDSINVITDNEVRRFKYYGALININFYLTINNTNHYNSFVDGAGFSQNEVNLRSNKMYNSFYIMDFFDSYDNNTQTKIFTIYQTQILDGMKSGETPIPKYQINSDSINQFNSWYIPESYIISQTGSTVSGYIKFSFYNAKYGKVAIFYNKDNQSLRTQEKMYFKVKLNLITMKWMFDYNGTNYPPNIMAYQIPFNNSYSEKINDNIQNFNNLQQVYPTGNTFQYEDGTYIIK